MKSKLTGTTYVAQEWFSTGEQNELYGHAAELMRTASEVDDPDIRRIVVRLARGVNRNTKPKYWVMDAALLAAFKPPTDKIKRKAERLEKKCERFHRVGFNPLLILGIISLVVQLIRLWKEWQRKESK